MNLIVCALYHSKFSNGLSRSETITATASLHAIEDFNCHRYSICCEISFDVRSIGIVRNTKTFTAEPKRKIMKKKIENRTHQALPPPPEKRINKMEKSSKPTCI